ncbi:MAG: RNA polymerase sigma factor [Anaerolineae bacterium]
MSDPLITALRRLDKTALAQVHNLYHDELYRFIAYRVGDAATAGDLTSEVFLRFLEACRTDKAPARSLRGWLYSVARNIVAAHLRRAYRRRETPLEDSLPADTTPLPDQLERSTQVAALREALGALTEDQQTVIALRYGSGLSIRDTAETMGKTEGSVKMLQARALKSLARLMGGGQ